MSEFQISAKIRDKFGKQNSSLRKNGLIPAVLYGHGINTVSLFVDAKEFSQIYKRAGESTIVSVDIDEEGKIKKQPVLIYDVDLDPVSDQIRHADFYAVRMDEKIKTKIHLVFIGESSAVKALGGSFIKNVHEVEVEALPNDLPHEIQIDISTINSFDDHICIKDLKVNSGVKIMGDPQEIIALVKPPRSEEELKALEGEVKVDVDSIKVEAEEKKKEEEAKKVAEEPEK